MPCYDPDANAQAYEDLLKKVHSLTDLLCNACTLIEAYKLEAELSPKLKKWWKHHKMSDAKRRETNDTTGITD